jgi:hypothetical protein
MIPPEQDDPFVLPNDIWLLANLEFCGSLAKGLCQRSEATHAQVYRAVQMLRPDMHHGARIAAVIAPGASFCLEMNQHCDATRS